MSEKEIYKIIELWFETDFEDGRHKRRIDKLDNN